MSADYSSVLVSPRYTGSAGNRFSTGLINQYEATFAEASIHAAWRDIMYRQLADLVILVSLPIAGCTLAASIAAGWRAYSRLRGYVPAM